ncbi:MAG: endonuclease [Clostridia bacterium]|nr:endonuclease [Clostridia bacterium]
MKGLKKISALLALTFIFAAPTVTVAASATAAPEGTGYTKATHVQYVTTGKIIHNWGARDEDCVFLSTYAQEFYAGDYAYETLSKNAGGTKQSDAPKSDLYVALQDMMEAEHTFYTYYDGSKNVRDYYKYADCVQSDTTQVSLIYRGTLTDSKWNQGNVWNQEHMWPQSKLSSSEQKGDIMHLRPSNPSENSQRGNTPYGEGGSYYDPNEEGQSIRGDCARIMLYMYVRWGLSSKMWGSSGAMESADVLLKWMAEDPVDTWEMGRNDAVQSITGTRNVFVDYPEYAWLLFGKDIPDDIVTPSGLAAKQECTHDFSKWITIKEATETEEGAQMRTCYDCGFAEQEVLPKTGDLVEEPAVPNGCESSVGVSAIGLTLAVGVGSVLKKKENE